MNACLKYFSASVLALLTQAAFAQVPELGAASDFTLLSAPSGSATGTAAQGTAAAAGAVTCTDSSITGNVGSTDPSDTVAATCIITGGSFIAPVTTGVLTDYYSAYDALEDVPCDQTLDQDAYTDTTLSFNPGVICSQAAVTFTRTTLRLTGGSNATWLFKIGTGGTGALTGTDSSVVMAGDACNVTWWTAQAATVTRGDFKGTILAGAAFTATGTATTGSTFAGRALAGRTSATAGVTVTDMTITGCEGGGGNGNGKGKCNQGVGNGPENCDPGNSNQDGHGSNPFDGARNTNDELRGTPGNPGRKGGNIK